MKPSDLPKDGNFSGRINKQAKAALKKLGMTEQAIIDAYLDAVLKVYFEVGPRYTTEKPKIAALRPRDPRKT